MCIAIWTLEHQDYALILCSNRDEFLDRPTQDAHFHSFDRQPGSVTGGSVLSGRDEKAGGTWFGVNRAGRVALLTNITEPVEEYKSSRGYLVSSFLLSDSSLPLEDKVRKLVPQDAKFAGFNLLLLAPESRPDGLLHFDSLLVTNHGSGGALTSRRLAVRENFCGGLSNGVDGAGATEWPKVTHATQEFDAILQTLSPDAAEAELTDRLFELLAWVSTLASDPSSMIFLTYKDSPKSWRCPEPVTQRSQFRKTVHVSPIPITLEGSPDVIPRLYSTRLSTVLLIRRNGRVSFTEKDAWKLVDGIPLKAEPSSQRTFRFQLPHRR